MSYYTVLENINPQLVIAIGPAGTGKTMHACKKGLYHLRNGTVDKLIITRPTVSIDNEQLGFLPGNMHEKMEPWTLPIYDFFLEELNYHELQNLVQKQLIEVSPLAYMRGRTFRNSYIIADEMQNASINQIKTLLTRLDDTSKVVLTGDLDQCDIENSGLDDLITRLTRFDYDIDPMYCHIQEFSMDDVQRSAFVKYILSIYSL